MKRSILAIAMIVFTIFSCEEKEDVISVSNLDGYPENFTVDNWQEFLTAPKEVMDRVESQFIDHQLDIRKTENTLLNHTNISNKKVDPVAIRQFGNVRVVDLGGGLIPLGNTLVKNERDSTVTSFIPLPGGRNFSITPPIRRSCYFHKQRSNGNFTIQEWAAGVNVGDIIRLVNHLGGNDPFDQLWQFLAADVDGNGQVNANDATVIADLILGNISEFPQVQILPQIERPILLNQPVFYVEENDYKKVQEKLFTSFAPPIQALYANLTCQTTGGIDRIAVKRGDLNRSWNLRD